MRRRLHETRAAALVVRIEVWGGAIVGREELVFVEEELVAVGTSWIQA